MLCSLVSLCNNSPNFFALSISTPHSLYPSHLHLLWFIAQQCISFAYHRPTPEVEATLLLKFVAEFDTMKDNILIAVFLVVGLLTPVFGWLFYCWFRSHVTSQHLQGQVFHRRSRDRTQASWHPGNGDTMHSTLGPHFTPHGWVRPKPYGETNALPLSQ